MFSANEILALGVWEAEKVLPGDENEVRKAYRSLAKKWHPDLSRDPLASKVLAHLTLLRDALIKRRPATAPVMSERLYMGADGVGIRFKYLRLRAGEVGDILIGRKSIAYEMPADFADVAENEKAMIAGIRFADDGMKAQMQHFLPKLEKTVVAGDKVVSILTRPADCVLLSDLVDHFGGRIPAEHVAWLISSLANMCCYLDWLKVSHGAISPTTVLVCPERHSVILLGGWGFATRYGAAPLAVPERTLSKAPTLAVEGSVGEGKTDLLLVRATAQDALGSSGGGGLMTDKGVPESVARWLLLPPKGGASADYESWGRCLTEAWGKRRFIKMDADPRKIYAN
jgi:hypothetical protein